ncbi:patatin-like phospholipase [Trypanosoma theileri]|uniref:Patatin-like phospholipase n=1 Tax=Trypanosoma theileri TaxID=67003 RepID=A0A1X0P9X6_9TRYP|nr:patatin-like phospholipase [Trypanosoma theileri]ORC93688.1 patatin-like phospholipase [Trypanosoma theileri]
MEKDKVCSDAGKAADDEFDLTFGFSAGGWFQMYHYGAAQALVDSGLLERMSNDGKRVRFCGASAGALVSVCLASKSYRFKEIRERAAKCAEHYRSSWLNLFCMKKYIVEALDDFGSHLKNLEMKPNIEELLNNGSLEIFVTTLPNMKRKIIRNFYSYDDIAEALLASCCMSPLVGVPFRLRATGEWVCDGALATVTPRKGESRTITVSPFYFSASTIHPSTFVPVWWGLCPPDDVAHRNLFALGYNDMIEGLVANSYIAAEEGEPLLIPEVCFEFERNLFLRFFGFVCDILVLIFLRPIVVSCIYIELAVMSFIYFMKGVFKLDYKPFKKLYNNVRNIVSLRTLGRFVFGDNVPHNRQRLEKSSRLYRVFEPIVLGKKKKTTKRSVISPNDVEIKMYSTSSEYTQ